MRFLLAIMAMALFAVSVGCEAPSETSSTSTPAATEGGSGTADAAPGDTQMVSLKLPGMTWGGCVRSVQGALEGIAGVTDISLDPGSASGKFSAPADLDVKMTLDKIVEGGNSHIKGYSMVE